jgi:hypothetical protein
LMPWAGPRLVSGETQAGHWGHRARGAGCRAWALGPYAPLLPTMRGSLGPATDFLPHPSSGRPDPRSKTQVFQFQKPSDFSLFLAVSRLNWGTRNGVRRAAGRGRAARRGPGCDGLGPGPPTNPSRSAGRPNPSLAGHPQLSSPPGAEEVGRAGKGSTQKLAMQPSRAEGGGREVEYAPDPAASGRIRPHREEPAGRQSRNFLPRAAPRHQHLATGHLASGLDSGTSPQAWT